MEECQIILNQPVYLCALYNAFSYKFAAFWVHIGHNMCVRMAKYAVCRVLHVSPFNQQHENCIV